LPIETFYRLIGDSQLRRLWCLA